jgi:FtsP/CotA-like multicopper oxidase with cupredoxin domain
MGLTGMIIVDDGSDDRLNLPRTYGVDDLPIILQDRSFDPDGSIGYDNNDLNALDIAYGARGDTIIVNGAIAPVAKVPSGLVRLRLLNAANAQNFDLRFKDRRTFHVIALQFEPTAGIANLKQVPKRLIDTSTVSASSAVRRRQFVLDSGLCASSPQASAHGDMPALIGINGKPFDLKRFDVETKLGTTEIWEITSIGMAHPFHVHGALFRILSIEGAPPAAHLTGWKDTVLVEDKAEILVAFNQPATRQHPFMYHCHILEHEDAGLMGQYICS